MQQLWELTTLTIPTAQVVYHAIAVGDPYFIHSFEPKLFIEGHNILELGGLKNFS